MVSSFLAASTVLYNKLVSTRFFDKNGYTTGLSNFFDTGGLLLPVNWLAINPTMMQITEPINVYQKKDILNIGKI